MTELEVQKKVQNVLHESFEVPRDKFQDKSILFSEFELDSLDVADMIVDLEQQIGKKIDIKMFLQVKTLGDLYSVVHKYVEH